MSFSVADGIGQQRSQFKVVAPVIDFVSPGLARKVEIERVQVIATPGEETSQVPAWRLRVSIYLI